MSRIAYVNGQYLPHRKAAVHIEDRGYQFADGIYEVCAVLNRQILDLDPHLARLHRSAAELHMALPMADGPLVTVMDQLLRRNRIREGILYLQITRGVAKRDHAFPSLATAPALVMTCRRFDFAAKAAQQQKGVAVITQPDQRWARRDIKSISLLPNALAKQAASEVHAYEAWMVDSDGKVTEGSSTNAWIITPDGALKSRALSADILPGITRQGIVQVAEQLQLKVVEEAFTLAEAQAAGEAFLTSTTSFCMPVVSLDGQSIGRGKPGPVSQRLVQAYWDLVAQQTGYQLGTS